MRANLFFSMVTRKKCVVTVDYYNYLHNWEKLELFTHIGSNFGNFGATFFIVFFPDSRNSDC